jgi:exodeoxyribonuclease VII large subunit
VIDRPCTVTEITRAVKQTLEIDFPTLWVVGEISQYTLHASGHRYFTLKDDDSQLRCVMWRSQQPGFEPEAGVEALAQGRLTVYERSGYYQLNVSQLLPVGVGQQQLALEQLKARLFEEGLFDETQKRELPSYPTTIGVVTSRSGAAIRDILNVLGRRFSSVRILLRPSLVQGEGAAEDIACGIEELNSFGQADVLIVGRGGGSAEDLSAFNTERVVRAITQSAIPVISAVGHEIDTSLADLAADCRAPTPSAAAELAVRDAVGLKDRISELQQRASDAVKRLLDENSEILDGYQDSYGLRRVEDLVLQNMQLVDDLQRSLQSGLRQTSDSKLSAYLQLTGKLGTLSPLSVLSRGFSLTHRLTDGRIVQDAEDLEAGDQLRVRLARGETICTVDQIIPDPPKSD